MPVNSVRVNVAGPAGTPVRQEHVRQIRGLRWQGPTSTILGRPGDGCLGMARVREKIAKLNEEMQRLE